MPAWAWMAVLLMAVLVSPLPGQGRTWRDRKGREWDFTTIQPALDAASPGDSILIGQGRFTETHVVETISWTESVYAEVKCDSISIKGSGPASSIMGEVLKSTSIILKPKGILCNDGYNGCHISDLAIENVYDGIYWIGGLEVKNCVVRGGVYGINMDPVDGLLVSNTEFWGVEDYGIFT